VAVVVAAADAPSEADLLAACAEQLSRFKRPRAVTSAGRLSPGRATGKVLKRETAPWAAAELGVLEQPS